MRFDVPFLLKKFNSLAFIGKSPNLSDTTQINSSFDDDAEDRSEH